MNFLINYFRNSATLILKLVSFWSQLLSVHWTFFYIAFLENWRLKVSLKWPIVYMNPIGRNFLMNCRRNLFWWFKMLKDHAFIMDLAWPFWTWKHSLRLVWFLLYTFSITFQCKHLLQFFKTIFTFYMMFKTLTSD